MKGLGICSTGAGNVEEYRKVIKVRMRIFAAIVLAGLITAGLAFYVEFGEVKTGINEHMLGVYAGMGVGLILAGIVLLVKNKFLLGNEEKLKESRLEAVDERLQMIANKAMRASFFVMLFAIYIIIVIGGLFMPGIVKVLGLVVGVFLISYLLFYTFYKARM